jgi:hypothetical protein
MMSWTWLVNTLIEPGPVIGMMAVLAAALPTT